MPAASASSSSSRTRSRRRSSRTVSRSSRTSSIAARWAPIPLMGDGAGIMVQIPHKFFLREMGAQGVRLPEAGKYAVGFIFMPRDTELRKKLERVVDKVIEDEGQTVLGWRDVPSDNSSLSQGPRDRGDRALPPAGLHRRRRRHRRRGRVRAQALHHPQGDVGQDLLGLRGQGERLLHRLDELPDAGLQGHVPRRAAPRLFRRPQRSRLRVGARARPPALLDQHLPVVAARPPLPVRLPQRRDQHRARQRQLDGGAPGVGPVAAVRRRHPEALADQLSGPVGHRLLRQRARVPAARRLLAAACGDDADPRGLGGQPADGRGPARLLRVPRRADGALGRPGRDVLLGRRLYRRDARPQRPPPVALHGHRRRRGHHGLGGRRAADRREQDQDQVAPAARQDAAHRPEAGPHRLRRGDQGASSPRRIPTRRGSGRTQIVLEELPAVHFEPKVSRRPAARAAAGVRLHPGRPEAPADPDGDHRAGSGRLDGHRHADLGALGQGEAPLHLLQAELRAGHQPADRLDPRRAGDEPRLVHRPAAQRPRPRRPRRAPAARGAPADPLERRPREDPRHRRHGGEPVPLEDARHHLPGERRRRRHGACARPAVLGRRDGGPRRRQHHHPLATARWAATGWRSRRCSRPRASTIT